MPQLFRKIQKAMIYKTETYKNKRLLSVIILINVRKIQILSPKIDHYMYQ